MKKKVVQNNAAAVRLISDSDMKRPAYKLIYCIITAFLVLMCMMTTLAVNTPPVGISMYTVNTILDVPLKDYCKEMVPFLIATMLMVLTLAFTPEVIMFLPELFF